MSVCLLTGRLHETSTSYALNLTVKGSPRTQPIHAASSPPRSSSDLGPHNMVAAEARTDDKRVVRILLECFFVHCRPQRSCEGYVFTGVCLSTGGGECLTRCTPPGPGAPLGPGVPPWDQVHPLDQVHPPDQVQPLRTRYTPLQDQVHPLGPGTTPRDQGHPPRPGTPPDQIHPPPGTGTPPTAKFCVILKHKSLCHSIVQVLLFSRHEMLN